MPEQQPDDVNAEDQAGAPDREFPISAAARFTIGGKPLVLDDFIDITTGDLANRPVAQSRPQPPPMPKEVIWASRRPVDD